MTVSVEFYGIPRQRAGVASVQVDESTLEGVLSRVALLLPTVANCCIDAGRLKPGYLANINGRTFTTDPQTRVNPGDTVILMSADVGG